eukprot:1140594-Pelagomonas_calceolata.AAC.2
MLPVVSLGWGWSGGVSFVGMDIITTKISWKHGVSWDGRSRMEGESGPVNSTSFDCATGPHHILYGGDMSDASGMGAAVGEARPCRPPPTCIACFN